MRMRRGQKEAMGMLERGAIAAGGVGVFSLVGRRGTWLLVCEGIMAVPQMHLSVEGAYRAFSL
jgi:hypothetical protein